METKTLDTKTRNIISRRRPDRHTPVMFDENQQQQHYHHLQGGGGGGGGEQKNEGYYYRDQSGQEKGPFDYASMHRGLAGTLNRIKSLQRQRGKGSNIGQMLAQDASLHGVPSHMVQNVIAPKFGLAENPSTKYETTREGKKEEKYAAANANQPTSLAVET